MELMSLLIEMESLVTARRVRKAEINRLKVLVKTAKESCMSAKAGIEPERAAILRAADEKAKGIIAKATYEAEKKLRDSENVRATQEKCKEIEAESYLKCEQIVLETKKHVDSLIAEAQRELNALLMRMDDLRNTYSAEFKENSQA
jgi:cell division septum initiation protein DivIVA